MIVLDVNVALAAFRQDHVHHERVRPWWDAALADGERFVIPDVVWVGFLRLSTNYRVFNVPATLDEALTFVAAVTAHPGYVHVGGLAQGLGGFAEVCQLAAATGNLVPDAYVASIARQWSCPVATLDRDFHRFAGLTIVEPSGA